MRAYLQSEQNSIHGDASANRNAARGASRDLAAVVAIQNNVPANSGS
jgi:hypothetical protein